MIQVVADARNQKNEDIHVAESGNQIRVPCHRIHLQGKKVGNVESSEINETFSLFRAQNKTENPFDTTFSFSFASKDFVW
jgi:uncharacterized protein YkuJ